MCMRPTAMSTFHWIKVTFDMTANDIINQLRLQHTKNLSLIFDGACEEYRKRLCHQWNLNVSDSWWIPSDHIGETLALNDMEYSLGMEDIRLLVDLNIKFEDFCEWWNYNLSAQNQVNSYNWFLKGFRPKLCR